jgi:hypothetical protein
MKTMTKMGLMLLSGVVVGPFLPLSGQETETVTVDRKPLALVPPEPPGTRKKAAEEPWLGVSKFSKPSMAAYAQLPKVPRGTGFMVERVSEGGPAELAGVAQYDVLWKLDDQLLVNQAQFMALLEMRAVGEVVRLTFSRGGENHEVEATLVARPESEKGRERADNLVFMPRIPGLPYQEVNTQYQTAVLREGKEVVRIQRVANRYKWVVFDDFGLEMTSGELASGKDDDFPPEVKGRLKGKLQALIRSLEGAEQRRGNSPRVRRVPVPKEGKS